MTLNASWNLGMWMMSLRLHCEDCIVLPNASTLRFWHVLAMWQAPTKRSGTIHGWQRKIPVIELLTAHFLLTWLSKINGKGTIWEQQVHAATLQIFKQMFAIPHIGTISRHVSSTGCGMFSNWHVALFYRCNPNAKARMHAMLHAIRASTSSLEK